VKDLDHFVALSNLRARTHLLTRELSHLMRIRLDVESLLRARDAERVIPEHQKLETIRATARDERIRIRFSFQSLADQIGMRAPRMRPFLDGAPLGVRELVSALRWLGGKKPAPAIAETVCVGVLASWAPRWLVPRIRMEIIEAVQAVYARHGLHLPADVFDDLWYRQAEALLASERAAGKNSVLRRRVDG
jgi:hypothetical protein